MRHRLPTLERRLGKVLAAARTDAGLSQEAVAAKARLHPTYISQIERGLKSPTVRAFVSIARALGIPADELIRRIESASDDR